MIDEEKSYKLSEFFKIMADATRLNILIALNDKSMSVGELCASLNMSMSAISHQLRILKQCDLVRYRREGKNVIYSVADEHVKLVVDMAFEHINEKI